MGLLVTGALLAGLVWATHDYLTRGAFDDKAFWANLWSGVLAALLVGVFLAVIVGLLVWLVQNALQGEASERERVDRHAREARRELHALRGTLRGEFPASALRPGSDPTLLAEDPAAFWGRSVRGWRFGIAKGLAGVADEQLEELEEEVAAGRFRRHRNDVGEFVAALRSYVPADRDAAAAADPLNKILVPCIQNVAGGSHLASILQDYCVGRIHGATPGDAVRQVHSEVGRTAGDPEQLESYWRDFEAEPEMQEPLRTYRAAYQRVLPRYKRLIETLRFPE